MALFTRHTDKSIVAVSAELNDEADWQTGILRHFDYHLNVCAFAFEPVIGLLAVGTTKGLVDIHGAPGVHVRLLVNDNAKINLLQFATSLSRLLCVDEHDRLYVWDLTTPGKPRLQKIMNYRHPVTALALSPSHQHAFIALANGEVHTYDLLCSRSSPYTMPNLWRLYEEKMVARGASLSPSDPSVSHIPLDLMVHPRDLNLLFVVYGGGVVLSDLSQRNILRAYELELPPGAPGGAGYAAPDLLTSRKPSVTAFAVHPSGHILAIGHADGSIAFWALEDEDKPVLVRTLDEDDTNLVDADKLNEMLSTHHSPPAPREPIFKITWSGFPNSSDPRGGETTLTVLGGLRSDEPPGVTAYLFPPLNPGEPPSPVDPSAGLHPFFRAAIKRSLSPINVHTYITNGITQDFLLIPRDSPHFSGTWDPVSILVMSEYVGRTRAVEAYEFPPTSFTSKVASTSVLHADDVTHPLESHPTIETDPIEDLTSELADTLEFMQGTDDPRSLRLPSSLWTGANGVVDGQLIALERDAYETLVDDREISDTYELPLCGGVAWVEDFEGEMKLMKLQPRRIFMTNHRDLTIRFQDISSQLLVSSSTSPLKYSFPSPLPILTIDLTSALSDPAIVTRTSPKFIDEAQIASVHLATESLECAAVLHTGEVILYRLIHSGGLHHPEDAELVSLHHIPALPGNRFRPAFAILSGMGSATAFAISDIGFMSVAYTSGLLFIIDMRGPRVLARFTPEARSSFLSRKDHADCISSLTWTVSCTAADPTYRVLLIATLESGSSTIYTLIRSQSGSWTVKNSPESAEATSHPIPGGSIVIDGKNGNRCRANRGGLATALASSLEDTEVRKTVWISAGAKGVKCTVNITGERIERVDWGSKVGKVERVEVVHKNAAAVLVAFTDKRQVLVYSLPYLELLHTLHLEQLPTSSLVTDTTGDFIEFTRHPPSGLISKAIYGTLFDIRRSGPYAPPTVNFTDEKRVIPPQPQPVSIAPTSYFTSWIGYITSQGMTGEQVDALLAGPDRPVAQPTPKGHTSAEAASGSPGSAYGAYTAQAQGIAASAATTASNLYSRLGAALSERTEGLGQLQESFDSLEQGSRKMLAQTKSLAAQQTAKRWFGF
ncbi:lethal giant larvae like, C-terminal-domain-containing protein [Cristinia sonorae]|uniref:Lethal giant larvae like, C-terminal-domain-containing protein n=1 Tax=Cristinia sonorae TaxID=1940300 RepID=A0A8K0XPN7_9AGAR|nr:lethal giant larvae like, C-terminal-domain-containing protein [Cristinia sonorae]